MDEVALGGGGKGRKAPGVKKEKSYQPLVVPGKKRKGWHSAAEGEWCRGQMTGSATGGGERTLSAKNHFTVRAEKK